MMNNCKLSIQDISKTYKNNKSVALDNVSVDVQAGEFLAILGPSGCGKTTLLRIIAGLLAPDSGKLLLDGNDITSAPASVYWRCSCSMRSGWVRFQFSGASPGRRPAACRQEPVPPSKKRSPSFNFFSTLIKCSLRGI